ncbi:hypothetical protein DPEC_G00253850 [Dallia pectoralis]|uniref:Uncharacterized protein n=1 Tax=Dallia pectoralis TaxID=75939 RepID=A0ACC2FU86_DALPE|nr:hypothetical protein DPEC_G00253850 [Dallia pectoralis]
MSDGNWETRRPVSTEELSNMSPSHGRYALHSPPGNGQTIMKRGRRTGVMDTRPGHGRPAATQIDGALTHRPGSDLTPADIPACDRLFFRPARLSSSSADSTSAKDRAVLADETPNGGRDVTA